MSLSSWIFGRFNLVRPTLVDGAVGPLAADADSVLLTRSAGASPSAGPITALPATGDTNTPTIVKGSPGDLLDVTAFNAGSVVLHLQIFDQTAALAGGETPFWISPPIPVGETIAWAWAEGLPFATGILIAPSTTRATYTLPAGGEDLNSAGRFR